MDENDMDNLRFLLNASEATIKEWYITVSDDDHQYASELLEWYAGELRNQSADLLTDSRLASEPWTESSNLLKKFRLNKE